MHDRECGEIRVSSGGSGRGPGLVRRWLVRRRPTSATTTEVLTTAATTGFQVSRWSLARGRAAGGAGGWPPSWCATWHSGPTCTTLPDCSHSVHLGDDGAADSLFCFLAKPLGELIKTHTDLTSADDAAHLQQLVGEWGMLADFCGPVALRTHRDDQWIVVGRDHPPGRTPSSTARRGLGRRDHWRHRAPRAPTPDYLASGQIVEERARSRWRASQGSSDAGDPGACRRTRIASSCKEWSTRTGRQPGELERTYLGIFEAVRGDDRRGTTSVRWQGRRLRRRP